MNRNSNCTNVNDFKEESAWLPRDPGFATVAIHAGYKPKDFDYAPVVPAISLATTYEQDAPAQHRVRHYDLFDYN